MQIIKVQWALLQRFQKGSCIILEVSPRELASDEAGLLNERETDFFF